MNKVLHHWNDKYQTKDLVFGTTPNAFMCEQSRRLRDGGHILAVGDGEGRNGVWLAEQGFQVLSVDGAVNGVNKAIEQAHLREVTDHFNALCADLLNWQWPVNFYDGVVCMHLYFMPQERIAMHQAMMDALKEGGLFILECFHPDNVGRGCGGPQLPELCYRASDLESDFKNYDIVFLEERERELAPSSFHNGGQAKVSRIVARK